MIYLGAASSSNTTPHAPTMQLTTQEYEQISRMIEFYRDFNEELYCDQDPDNLFTAAQKNVFRKFEVHSLKPRIRK